MDLSESYLEAADASEANLSIIQANPLGCGSGAYGDLCTNEPCAASP